MQRRKSSKGTPTTRRNGTGTSKKIRNRLEKKVEEAEAHGNRFDLAETLLEIGLVVTSVTLLTKSRIYWFLGLGFAAAGILSAISVIVLK